MARFTYISPFSSGPIHYIIRFLLARKCFPSSCFPFYSFGLFAFSVSFVVFLPPWQPASCLSSAAGVLCLCDDFLLRGPHQALLRPSTFKWACSLANGSPQDPLLMILSGHFCFYRLQLSCSPVPHSTPPLCPSSVLVKSSVRVLAFVLKSCFLV